MDAYIIDGVRTPIGNFSGSLSSVRADDLGAFVIKELLTRNPSVPIATVDEVIFGCANQSGEDNRNVARMSLLLAGLPPTVPGITVNRLCASGLSAVNDAARLIHAKEGSIVVAGGVEQMTRAPYVLSKSSTPFGRNSELFDTTMGWRFVNPKMKELYGTDSMGETAENVAHEFGVSRTNQDEFAFHSQRKAQSALISGRFDREIVPIEVSLGKGNVKLVDKDEFIKGSTTLEALSTLKAAFRKDGSVTAGNSSGINDGACSPLLASSEAIKNFNLIPRSKIVASAAVGVPPRIMGIGPVGAINKVLNLTGLSLKDIDVIELNEAFAAQSVACLNELKISLDDPRVNPNGGAIALGHPLGMSGARLVLTATHELQERKAKYALCALCVGVGQGVATIIERI